jgi:hypothetical protein
MVIASAGLDVQRDTSPPSAPLAVFTYMMLLAPINWESHGVTHAGYCYARYEAWDESSDRNYVSCQSLATLRRYRMW